MCLRDIELRNCFFLKLTRDDSRKAFQKKLNIDKNQIKILNKDKDIETIEMK